MQRGNRIHQSLFAEEFTSIEVAMPERKGRSEELINERNELLLYRYYYYSRLCGYALPKVYKLLRPEIFLEERTIANTVQQQALLLKKIAQEKPTVEVLRKKYPWLIWVKMELL